MAQVQRHRRAIAAALLGLVALVCTPARAQDQGAKDSTDLYEGPVLAVDPGMHTGAIRAQAIDANEHYAVTGGSDRTVRVWSVADGSLLQTIWMPIGPIPVGVVTAVAISADGSTIAVGGFTETLRGEHPIYVFDREKGALIRRIRSELLGTVTNLRFSPDGRFLAAVMAGGKGGLRIFDRTNGLDEAYRDDAYESLGVSFARDGRLATASLDGKIRLYEYDPDTIRPTFHTMGDPVQTSGGGHPYRIAFSPDGSRLAVGFGDRIAVDVLDGKTLQHLGGHPPTGLEVPTVGMAPFQVPAGGLSKVAWSIDGLTLFATGAVTDVEGRSVVLAWDRSGLGDERRFSNCAHDTAADVNTLPSGRVFVASMEPCLGLLNANGAMVWSVQSQIIRLYPPPGQIVEGYQSDRLKLSQDGRVVDFRYGAANAFATAPPTHSCDLIRVL
jgi:WD40 repeat protein